MRKNQSRLEALDIKCTICGEYFTPRSKASKYCGDKCRTAALNENFAKRKKLTDFVIFERDNFKCIYCGKSSIEDGIKLILEHIYPVKRGGGADMFNIVTSCSVCNGQKSDRMMSEDNILRLWNEIERRNEISGIEHYQTLVDHLQQQLKNRQDKLITLNS